jgi:hypothetical protein
MARRTRKETEPAIAEDVVITPEEGKIEAPKVEEPTAAAAEEPVNIEKETPSSEPEPAKKAAAAEKIQTDVRQKLAKKSADEDAFVPANPVALEKAAGEVAKENGFELNRGTSVGARLMARAQKRV